MKLFLACLVLLFAVSFASLQVVSKTDQVSKPEGSVCDFCIKFLGDWTDALLAIIESTEVGSCAAICELLNVPEIETVACELLCDYVGITAFIDLVEMVDPDPFFFCEELSVCGVNDNAAAKLTKFYAYPSQIQAGNTLTIYLDYNVTNKIATGELVLAIKPPSTNPGQPFGETAILVDQVPGEYYAKFQLDLKPSEQEPFTPGTYVMETAICEGMCGSKHEHTKLLAEGEASFKIVE